MRFNFRRESVTLTSQFISIYDGKNSGRDDLNVLLTPPTYTHIYPSQIYSQSQTLFSWNIVYFRKY